MEVRRSRLNLYVLFSPNGRHPVKGTANHQTKSLAAW